jgi:hypothetical protein
MPAPRVQPVSFVRPHAAPVREPRRAQASHGGSQTGFGHDDAIPAFLLRGRKIAS